MPLYGGSALIVSPKLLLAAADPAAAAIFAFRTEPLRPQTALFPLLCSLFSLLLMLLLAAVVDPDAVVFVVAEASVLTCSLIVHLIAPLKVDLSSACCVSVREVYVGPLQQCRSEGSCHAVSWAEPALYTNGVFSASRPWMRTSRSAHVIQKSLWHLRHHQRHQFSAERSRA